MDDCAGSATIWHQGFSWHPIRNIHLAIHSPMLGCVAGRLLAEVCNLYTTEVCRVCSHCAYHIFHNSCFTPLAKATCLGVLAIRIAVLIHLWLAPALGPLNVAMPVQVSKDMVDTSNNTGEIQARHSCSEKAATYSYTSTYIPQTRHVEAYCPRHEENPTEAAVLRNMLTRHSHQ